MFLKKAIFLCLCLVIFNYLFQAINIAKKIPFNNEEISNIGTGIQVISNVKNNNNYAIVQPPLPGILSAILIGETFKNDTLLIGNDKYYDFISYLQTMYTPYIIGNAILENFEGNLILRYASILSILVVSLCIYTICRFCTNSVSATIFSVIFFLIQIYSSYEQIIRINGLSLTQIFLWSGLITMMSILQKLNTCKSIILGGLFAGAAMSGGGNAIILMLILLMSCLISKDIARKKISNGFNKKWTYCILLLIFTFFFILWLGYGAKMSAPEDLIIQPFYVFFKKYNMEKQHIIAFMDIIKKFIFDVLFSQSSDVENTISIIGRYNFFIEKLVFLPSILCGIFYFKKRKIEVVPQYIITLFIITLLLLLSIGLYRDPATEAVKSYMQMVMLFILGINAIIIVYLAEKIIPQKYYKKLT